MMMTKIVADSSADLLTLGDLPFASVPLTIHAGDRVFVGDEHCDIDGMIAFLRGEFPVTDVYFRMLL